MPNPQSGDLRFHNSSRCVCPIWLPIFTTEKCLFFCRANTYQQTQTYLIRLWTLNIKNAQKTGNMTYQQVDRTAFINFKLNSCCMSLKCGFTQVDSSCYFWLRMDAAVVASYKYQISIKGKEFIKKIIYWSSRMGWWMWVYCGYEGCGEGALHTRLDVGSGAWLLKGLWGTHNHVIQLSLLPPLTLCQPGEFP